MYSRIIEKIAGLRMSWADRQRDQAWAQTLAEHEKVYGCDYAPLWATRPEWTDFYPGVEIDQYRNGH